MPDPCLDRFVAHGLLEREGRFLVLRRREGRYLGGQWDIPGGTVEPGEAPSAAAVRECLEETALRTEPGEELTRVVNDDTEGRDLRFHAITYRLHEVGDAADIRLNPEEHDEHRWVGASEAADLPLVWHVRRTIEVAVRDRDHIHSTRVDAAGRLKP